MAGGVAPIFIVFLLLQLKKAPIGKYMTKRNDLIDELALQIKSGAMACLKEQYNYLAVFVLALTAILAVLYCVNLVSNLSDSYKQVADGGRIAFAFFVGHNFKLILQTWKQCALAEGRPFLRDGYHFSYHAATGCMVIFCVASQFDTPKLMSCLV